MLKSHSKTMMNKRIDKIHEKVLKLVHKKMNQNFFFDSLLKKRTTQLSIHQRKLQILATEIYRVGND